MTLRDKCDRYELLIWCIMRGIARWEFFTNSTDAGEICCGGIRYSTNMIDGVPEICNHVYVALSRAKEAKLRKP